MPDFEHPTDRHNLDLVRKRKTYGEHYQRPILITGLIHSQFTRHQA